MTGHFRVTDHAGSGGPCGDGYHLRCLVICKCGWRAEVAWAGNTCDCVSVHTAPGLEPAYALTNRLMAKHVRTAEKQAQGQGVLL